MLSFDFLHYHVLVDPVYAFELLNELWAKEPAGMISICITLTGLVLTLTFKVLDWLMEAQKEHARQGRLRIELEADVDLQGRAVLWAVISNTGREPIVVRDIGYTRARLLGKDFIPVAPNQETLLPHALNARDLVRIPIAEDTANLNQLVDSFRIKDSMGKLWDVPDSEIRRARRRLKVLHTERGRQSQVAANRQQLLDALETAPPLTTQN